MAIVSFTQEEAELIKDTAKIALANAAKSFAKMLQDEVILQHLALHLSPSDVLHSVKLDEDKYFVLRTEIVGQMKANSFLIFSDNNATKTYKALLPKSLIGNPEMREAMLLEVDNILAASVVTKYADILNRKITGHIPEIQTYSPEMVAQIIPTQLQQHMDFSFRVNFQAQKTGISAEFVCFFTEMFALTIAERTPLSETSDMVSANKSDSELASIMNKIRDVINQILGG